jgi:hypothetical protein
MFIFCIVYIITNALFLTFLALSPIVGQRGVSGCKGTHFFICGEKKMKKNNFFIAFRKKNLLLHHQK